MSTKTRDQNRRDNGSGNNAGRSPEAVIYCRVSSVKQSTVGDGLKSQETRCREFARMKRYDVAQVFSDDVSGSLTDRPGMTAMLTFIRKRRTAGTVVVIDDVSRLARGLQAHLELRGMIARAGGVLESPSIEFGEDSDSILVENLLASVSQHQRQKNGEQTKNRMRSRVMNGYWVFQPPVGYKYAAVSGRGKMLKRNEPVASVIAEALEGYASARFETQADVMRFLQDHPLFPKDTAGLVRHQRVGDLLDQSAYAGLIEAKDWGVSLRTAQHEPLVSVATYQRVQERLRGVGRMPKRQNLNADFPLRGFVLCDDCGSALTACWSTGRAQRHAYYLCHKRGCASYGKSIKRDVIEGAVETLLHELRPTPGLFRVAAAMFEELWNAKAAQGAAQAKALQIELLKIEKQVGQFLERIVDATMPSVIGAYEARVARLEQDRLVIKERMASAGAPKTTFEGALRTALDFLANPCKLWTSERLNDRRAVLKLAFAQPLRYARNEGFRTADLALPFKLLAGYSGCGNSMVPRRGIEPLF